MQSFLVISLPNKCPNSLIIFTYVVVPGSNATLNVEEVAKAEQMIQNARLVSFGLEGNHDSVIKALELAKKHGVKTMTNAAPARSDLDPK